MVASDYYNDTMLSASSIKNVSHYYTKVEEKRLDVLYNDELMDVSRIAVMMNINPIRIANKLVEIKYAEDLKSCRGYEAWWKFYTSGLCGGTAYSN